MSWRWCRSAGVVLLVASRLLAQPLADGSKPRALALRWSDPDQLAPATAQDFSVWLSARLGRPAFDPNAEQQALSVAWRGSREHCRVELQLSRGSEVQGTRVLESPAGDCRSLLPALLTVAALLEAQAPAPPESSPTTSSPTTSSPTTSAEPTAVQRSPSPASGASPSEPRLWLGLGGALGTGTAPKPELGAALTFAWQPLSSWRIGMDGVWYLTRKYGAAPGFELGHQQAALFACGMPLSGDLGLGLCARTSIHRFDSEGLALPRAQRRASVNEAVGMDGRLEWRLLRSLWWVAHAGAEAALRPLYFYYLPAGGGEATLFEQRRLSARVLLGLSLEVP